MSTYKELVAQREALEKQIAQARQNEISQAVNKVRELITEFGLTPKDVFSSTKSSKTRSAGSGVKVAPKYRNPVTGDTWTGRGKAPKWIDGKDRAQYLIA